MPVQPTRSQLHVNQLLTNMSIAYQQTQDLFVADKVFPVIPVKKQSDRYLVYLKDDWFRTIAAKRSPASESVGTGYSLDNTPTYFCDIWAAHHDVPWEDYDNADEIINPDDDAQALVTSNLLLRRELVWSNLYMKTGTWQGYKVSGSAADFLPATSPGSGYWGSASANPAADIALLKGQVQAQTGFVPNTLTLTSDVFYALQNNPNFIDRYKYTQAGILTKDLMAGVFGVDRLFVIGAVLNSAQENQPASMAFIARNSFLLSYSPPAAGLRKPSAGYTFSWTGRRVASGYSTSITKIPMELKKADRVEGEMAFSMRQTGADLGVFGTQVLSAT